MDDEIRLIASKFREAVHVLARHQGTITERLIAAYVDSLVDLMDAPLPHKVEVEYLDIVEALKPEVRHLLTADQAQLLVDRIWFVFCQLSVKT